MLDRIAASFVALARMRELAAAPLAQDASAPRPAGAPGEAAASADPGALLQSAVSALAGGASDLALAASPPRPEAQRLNGDDGPERIVGGAADDEIRAGGGADTVIGGGGADIVFLGAGDDRYEAGDALGGPGAGDRVRGGGGEDMILGGGGRDFLGGGAGSDVINGGAGADTINGGAGADVLRGQGGPDLIRGQGGADRLVGGGGADTLLGGAGGDRLLGRAGSDRLDGGAGNDVLTGGGRADLFLFTGSFGADRITDFNPGAGDRIDLTGAGVSFLDLEIGAAPGRPGSTLVDAGVGSITLLGVDPASLTRDAFIFGVGPEEKTGGAANSGDNGKVETTGVGQISLQTGAGGGLIGLDGFRGDAEFAGFRGAGYTVAVIDTGIDLNHRAFGPDANRDGVSDRILYTEDFSTDRDGTADDVNGHGTNVASIVGSSDPRFPGVAPEAGIIALQALSNAGGGRSSDIEAALDWVIRNASVYNIVAVNLSLGPSDNVSTNRRNAVLGDEFARLAEAGVIVTAAAGNDYFAFQSPGVSSLAADPNVIPVGALWSASFGAIEFASGAKDFETAAGRVTSFSQRSATLDQVFAPGALITGAAPGGGSSALGGTSQAAPFVAGMAALAQEIAEDRLGRRLTPDEFHNLLIDTAVTIRDGDDEVDNVVNLNANLPQVNMLALARAIDAMGERAGPPPPPPDDDFSGDRSAAGRVAVGGTARGEIETAGDRDWFAVSLVEGRTYVFEQRGAPTRHGTLSDPLLALVDRRGEVIVTDDDDGGGLNARIEYTAQASGRLFLSAQAFGATTGTYEVRVRDLGERGPDDAPANRTTTSRLTPDGSVKQGVIEVTGDRDWHRVALEAGVRYVIDLAGAGAEALADPFLRIRDGSGALLAANDDGGEGRNARIEFTPATSGRFFVEAGAFGETGTGGYAITVAPVRIAGDIPADASTGATLAVGGTFRGALEEEGDRDWVRVTLESGSVYDIALAGDGRNGAALADPLLRVRDANGAVVGFNDDFDGLNSRLDRFSVFETGTYFIEAAAFGDSATGDYRISLARLQGGAGDIPADASTTARMGPGGVFASELDFAGDRDWVRLDVVAGRSYRIALESAASGGVPDPLLRVYNARGDLLASDDDGGGNRNALLVFTAAETGTVFLEAASYLDRGEGAYRLSSVNLGRTDDFGADPASAGFAEIGQSVAGIIERAGDEDWIGFRLEAGAFHRFSLRGVDTSGGTLADPLLSIHDSRGFRLAVDDDGGAGLDAQLDFFAPATGLYFVAAQAFGEETGSWLLETA